MIEKEQATHLRQLFAADPGKKEFPREALEYIYEKGLFRLFIPKALNGKQSSISEAMRIIEECAYVDGDFGWAVQIGAGGGFFAGFFPEETAQKYFPKKDFVIAGSGFPGGNAKEEGGSFRVSGQWKYASGCGYATLFTASTFLNGTDQIRACAFLPAQVQILNDWDAYGMQQTLSHSIRLDGVEVPREMTFDTTQVINDYGYKLYNFPFMAFARSCILSSLAGCFRHLLEELERYISEASPTPEKSKALKELYAEIAQQDREMRQQVLAAAEKAWNSTRLSSPAPEAEVEAFDAAMRQQIDFINREAYRIFSAVGMAATEHSSQLNKVWRDLTTAAQHVILK